MFTCGKILFRGFEKVEGLLCFRLLPEICFFWI